MLPDPDKLLSKGHQFALLHAGVSMSLLAASMPRDTRPSVLIAAPHEDSATERLGCRSLLGHAI